MAEAPEISAPLSLPPRVADVRDLLLEQLGKLLTVEETLVKLVLPELTSAIGDSALKETVESHLGETGDHVGNLKRAFLTLSEVPAGRPAEGFDGLRAEHARAAEQVDPGLRDGIHCAAAMGTEHYEINAYEAAIRSADALGAGEVGRLLRANLDQEVEALGRLGAHADRLAQQASSG
jgi:ferritin-like metal-binding protein YciE